MINTFKFLQKPKDYNLHIQNVPMFRVYTYDEITQSKIDKMNETIEPYILLPNTQDNRDEMMNLLSQFFITIESIYVETI